ncbi:hypothetical protein QA641_36270 [Bradyrhizobium sp. CB1650]|uniref:hypothetical protein n=1 Tax=Bradyrhizobium sp. CB1650 TaxID=3039153 RepID=UPI0024353ECF|nr:hypothetical protein [Bradyrhizobium sp. CB1650]WGD50978.1 hypothetical protein QA641_36270 [Bradyrhizobium sp. CB1650]
MIDDKGKELIRVSPLAIVLSQGEITGKDVVPILLKDFEELIQEQGHSSLKSFLFERADYLNKLLYATDGGSMLMAETLGDLMEGFKRTYHDLLWTLVILVGAQPPRKEWGIVSQFVDLYREMLIKTGILRADNTASEAAPELA